MAPRLSGHFSTIGLVFFVLKSLLGISRQWSREKFAILSLRPLSHVKILIYRKIPKINPVASISQGPFFGGLYSEGLIYEGKFAFQNRLGNPVYRFCFVLLCI